MAKLLGVKSLMTTAYHPQTNGQVERFNRLIATALTAFVNETQTDWDDFLEFIAFAYRTSVCESIGDTPFHLVCGRDARLPTTVLDGHAPGKSPVVPKDYGEELVQKLQEAFRAAKDCQAQADRRRKFYYDSRHVPVDFKVGELVLLHSKVTKPGLSPKLSVKWTGPYRVNEKLSDVNYWLEDVGSQKRVRAHVQRMAPYYVQEEEADSDGQASETESEKDLIDAVGESVQMNDQSSSGTATCNFDSLVTRSGRVVVRPERLDV